MPMASPPPPPPPVAKVAKADLERAIGRRISRVRTKHGLRGVRFSIRLRKVARRHSREMLRRDVLTHTTASGASLSARLSRAGHRRHYGEVLAWTPRGVRAGARRVVRMWMQSPSHRQVLLDGRLRRIGVGRVRGAMGRQHGIAITADFSS
jgi:uncharacterized protein YkwD